MTPTERCIEVAIEGIDEDIAQACDELWSDLVASGLSEAMRDAMMQRIYVQFGELRERHVAKITAIFRGDLGEVADVVH